MEKRSVAQIEKQLEAQRKEILRSVRQFDDQGRSLQPDYPQDVGERAVVEYSKEFLFRLSNDQRNRLRAIDAALHRIRIGTFGICVACGDEIAPKRLQALPWTELCVRCQEKQERGERVLEADTV